MAPIPIPGVSSAGFIASIAALTLAHHGGGDSMTKGDIIATSVILGILLGIPLLALIVWLLTLWVKCCVRRRREGVVKKEQRRREREREKEREKRRVERKKRMREDESSGGLTGLRLVLGVGGVGARNGRGNENENGMGGGTLPWEADLGGLSVHVAEVVEEGAPPGYSRGQWIS